MRTANVRCGVVHAAQKLAAAWGAKAGRPVSLREAVDGAILLALPDAEAGTTSIPDQVVQPRGGHGSSQPGAMEPDQHHQRPTDHPKANTRNTRTAP